MFITLINDNHFKLDARRNEFRGAGAEMTVTQCNPRSFKTETQVQKVSEERRG